MFCRVSTILLSACTIVTTQTFTIAPAQAQAAAAAQCAANPYCVGIVVVGGIAYMMLSNGTRMPIQHGGYLEDPEGESEPWTEYVWGDDIRQAQATCQQKAIAYGVVLEGVRHIRGKSYECQFRTYRS